MTTLSWKCRGLGNPKVVHNLKYLAHNHKPIFIFLTETLATLDQMDTIRHQLGSEGLFCVERKGRGGGLVFLWKESDQAKLIGYSQ